LWDRYPSLETIITSDKRDALAVKSHPWQGKRENESFTRKYVAKTLRFAVVEEEKSSYRRNAKEMRKLLVPQKWVFDYIMESTHAQLCHTLCHVLCHIIST